MPLIQAAVLNSPYCPKYKTTSRGQLIEPYKSSTGRSLWRPVVPIKSHRGRTYRLDESKLPQVRWVNRTPDSSVTPSDVLAPLCTRCRTAAEEAIDIPDDISTASTITEGGDGSPTYSIRAESDHTDYDSESIESGPPTRWIDWSNHHRDFIETHTDPDDPEVQGDDDESLAGYISWSAEHHTYAHFAWKPSLGGHRLFLREDSHYIEGSPYPFFHSSASTSTTESSESSSDGGFSYIQWSEFHQRHVYWREFNSGPFGPHRVFVTFVHADSD